MIKNGTRIWLSGDSADYGISDYNVRISSGATVLVDNNPNDPFVLVSVDEIDGDRNVCVSIRRSALSDLR